MKDGRIPVFVFWERGLVAIRLSAPDPLGVKPRTLESTEIPNLRERKTATGHFVREHWLGDGIPTDALTTRPVVLDWTGEPLKDPVWRAAVKRVTGELFAELRRTGLMKRVVGVHYYGCHDGRFAMPILDYSPCAKAEYARYLKENGLKEDDPAGSFEYFSKQLGLSLTAGETRWYRLFRQGL